MKSYTDLEQSKKLAEFLPIESADNVTVSIGDREGVKTITMPKETLNILKTPFTDIRNTIPCWSLAALLDVLPKPDLVQNSEGTWLVHSWVKAYPWSVGGYSNPIDTCYNIIIRLHELNLL